MSQARIPSLRHLDVLRAVVRHGGVHAAARMLGLSPSTVSVHLAGLSRSLGTGLVRRRGRGLEPTESGRAVAAA
ncbi:MAG: LysR family transcriptional regulator, partial [Planctomycetes bacterium]|nr:LysR family transcriptional regulator [Planctomycetota bacterium]